jgi:uncharacterized protein (TIGR00369 family)
LQFTDDQIRALLRDPAQHPPSAHHLGFELIDFSVEGGWAEVAFTPRPEFANPTGAVQGGFVCAMLDDAMDVTASISQRFAVAPTLQISVSYLRPTPMSRVMGRGEVLRMGGSTAHLQGTLRLPDRTLLANRHGLSRTAIVSETGLTVLLQFARRISLAHGANVRSRFDE